MDSITTKFLKKIRINQMEYKWADTRCIKRYDGPEMLYLLLRSTNSDTRIGVSNLRYEIEK